jgi:hypothetical protein
MDKLLSFYGGSAVNPYFDASRSRLRGFEVLSRLDANDTRSERTTAHLYALSNARNVGKPLKLATKSVIFNTPHLGDQFVTPTTHGLPGGDEFSSTKRVNDAILGPDNAPARLNYKDWHQGVGLPSISDEVFMRESHILRKEQRIEDLKSIEIPAGNMPIRSSVSYVNSNLARPILSSLYNIYRILADDNSLNHEGEEPDEFHTYNFMQINKMVGAVEIALAQTGHTLTTQQLDVILAAMHKIYNPTNLLSGPGLMEQKWSHLNYYLQNIIDLEGVVRKYVASARSRNTNQEPADFDTLNPADPFQTMMTLPVHPGPFLRGNVGDRGIIQPPPPGIQDVMNPIQQQQFFQEANQNGTNTANYLQALMAAIAMHAFMQAPFMQTRQQPGQPGNRGGALPDLPASPSLGPIPSGQDGPAPGTEITPTQPAKREPGDGLPDSLGDPNAPATTTDISAILNAMQNRATMQPFLRTPAPTMVVPDLRSAAIGAKPLVSQISGLSTRQYDIAQRRFVTQVTPTNEPPTLQLTAAPILNSGANTYNSMIGIGTVPQAVRSGAIDQTTDVLDPTAYENPVGLFKAVIRQATQVAQLSRNNPGGVDIENELIKRAGLEQTKNLVAATALMHQQYTPRQKLGFIALASLHLHRRHGHKFKDETHPVDEHTHRLHGRSGGVNRHMTNLLSTNTPSDRNIGSINPLGRQNLQTTKAHLQALHKKHYGILTPEEQAEKEHKREMDAIALEKAKLELQEKKTSSTGSSRIGLMHRLVNAGVAAYPLYSGAREFAGNVSDYSAQNLTKNVVDYGMDIAALANVANLNNDIGPVEKSAAHAGAVAAGLRLGAKTLIAPVWDMSKAATEDRFVMANLKTYQDPAKVREMTDRAAELARIQAYGATKIRNAQYLGAAEALTENLGDAIGVAHSGIKNVGEMVQKSINQWLPTALDTNHSANTTLNGVNESSSIMNFLNSINPLPRWSGQPDNGINETETMGANPNNEGAEGFKDGEVGSWFTSALDNLLAGMAEVGKQGPMGQGKPMKGSAEPDSDEGENSESDEEPMPSGAEARAAKNIHINANKQQYAQAIRDNEEEAKHDTEGVNPNKTDVLASMASKKDKMGHRVPNKDDYNQMRSQISQQSISMVNDADRDAFVSEVTGVVHEMLTKKERSPGGIPEDSESYFHDVVRKAVQRVAVTFLNNNTNHMITHIPTPSVPARIQQDPQTYTALGPAPVPEPAAAPVISPEAQSQAAIIKDTEGQFSTASDPNLSLSGTRQDQLQASNSLNLNPRHPGVVPMPQQARALHARSADANQVTAQNDQIAQEAFDRERHAQNQQVLERNQNIQYEEEKRAAERAAEEGARADVERVVREAYNRRPPLTQELLNQWNSSLEALEERRRLGFPSGDIPPTQAFLDRHGVRHSTGEERAYLSRPIITPAQEEQWINSQDRYRAIINHNNQVMMSEEGTLMNTRDPNAFSIPTQEWLDQHNVRLGQGKPDKSGGALPPMHMTRRAANDLVPGRSYVITRAQHVFPKKMINFAGIFKRLSHNVNYPEHSADFEGVHLLGHYEHTDEPDWVETERIVGYPDAHGNAKFPTNVIFFETTTPPGGGRMPQGSPVRPGPMEGGVLQFASREAQERRARAAESDAALRAHNDDTLARVRHERAEHEARLARERQAAADAEAHRQAVANFTKNAVMHHPPSLQHIVDAGRGGSKKRKASEWSELVKETYHEMKKTNPNVTIAQAAQAASKRRKEESQKKS